MFIKPGAIDEQIQLRKSSLAPHDEQLSEEYIFVMFQLFSNLYNVATTPVVPSMECVHVL